MNQPKQVYVVKITTNFNVPGWGNYTRTMAFSKQPSAQDIQDAVKAANSYYTDHAGLHDFLTEVAANLKPGSGNGGWSRFVQTTYGEAQVVMSSEDYFLNDGELK